MGTLFENGDQFIKSNEPATPAGKQGGNRLGQNGYTGPSSDTPGKETNTGFAQRDNGVPYGNDQTRHDVSREPLPTAFGHRNPNASPVKVPGNSRPVTTASASNRKT